MPSLLTLCESYRFFWRVHRSDKKSTSLAFAFRDIHRQWHSFDLVWIPSTPSTRLPGIFVMGKGTKPRVNANGKLVLPGGEVTSSNEQSTSASISDGGGGSSPCSALRSTRTVDFFGFNLDIRKLLTALAVAYFIMGPGGSK
jgi:hypothetical protein